MPMRHFDVAERRRRLLVRHHLARPAASVEQVAGDLVGVHSSDPATVDPLARRARLDPFAVADLEDALYERRLAAAHPGHAAHDVRRPARPRRGDGRFLHQGSRAGRAAQARPRCSPRRASPTTSTPGSTGCGRRHMAALATNDPLPANVLTKLVPDLALRVAGSRLARSTRAPWGCRRGCCSSCRPKVTSCAPGLSARGCRASTGGLTAGAVDRRPPRRSSRDDARLESRPPLACPRSDRARPDDIPCRGRSGPRRR